MRRTGTTRRGALTATGALTVGALLSGCGSDADDTGGGRKGSAHGGARTAADGTSSVRTEKVLRTSASRTTASLLAGYEHVLEAHPSTATALVPLRDAVRAHLKAITPGKAQALGTARSRATGPAAAVKELAAAERGAADTYTALLLEAPGELARLLASVAAACSAHAYLLTELAKETPA
ncbi:hypothetical protein E6P78_28760 [Streptomyces sp. A0958]|uniref:hypothetical protein n=1 Tax=Streptomyces sp. A0958 TaxID=2563101 RepID=UPI00109E43D9|nr:hypothetical protein [Streptomyces sp. A0958]THA59794.1 hypothetical protein E6P78_28760 [Streptomyces sp. A0958]